MRNLGSHFAPLHKNGIVRELAEDLIVYEKKTDTVYCLNSTAAQVWKLCDGKRTVSEITEALAREVKSPVDKKLIWVTLKKLWVAGEAGGRKGPVIT
jgi:Coenzyme PQQ synthesis protein D (PqqD)